MRSGPPDKDLQLLIQQIAKGDKAAMATLYRVMEQPLFRFIDQKLNDPFASHDILHDVFMNIWASAYRFEGKSSVRTWMFAITYRKVMDVFRSGSRVQVTDRLPEMVDESASAFDNVARAEQASGIRACLDGLKPEHRAVVELAFFEDMSYREIAAVVDAPEGTVKTRVYHAKQLLLRCLQSASIGRAEP